MSKKKYTGEISIHGKEYKVAVIDGKPFIDGVPYEKWLETADWQVILDIARAGVQTGFGRSGSVQTAMDLLYIDGDHK